MILRVVCILLSVLITADLYSAIVDFKNKYLNLAFDDVNYRFSLQREFIPSKEYSKDLLFFNVPPTSYILVNVDGLSYNLNEGRIIIPPFTDSDGVFRFVCEVQDIVVSVRFYFEKNESSGVEDALSIEVSLSNAGNNQRSVGVRYLLDTVFGENEVKPKFYIDGRNAIDYELLVDRNNMISYVVSSSDINGVNNLYINWNREPSRIVFSNWRKINIANWSVEPSSFLRYRFSETSGEDAAVAIFFEGFSLKPGEMERMRVVLSTSMYMPSRQSVEKKVEEPKPQDVVQAVKDEPKTVTTEKVVVVVTNYVFLTNEMQTTRTQEVVLQREVLATNVVTNVITNIVPITQTQNVYQPVVYQGDEEIRKKIYDMEKKIDKLFEGMNTLFTQLTNVRVQEEVKKDKQIERDVADMKRIRNIMVKLSKTLDNIEERVSMINKYIEIRKRFADKRIVVYTDEEYRRDLKLIDEISTLLDEIMKEITLK
ncbi:MAG: hypothetical protein RMJ37_07355 [Spirochaetia bacterium]|nr:hypothetical protein [Spirochaetota bacterium]MDW8113129.1 hypothetical protein [Spirochaetia bacterium]